MQKSDHLENEAAPPISLLSGQTQLMWSKLFHRCVKKDINICLPVRPAAGFQSARRGWRVRAEPPGHSWSWNRWCRPSWGRLLRPHLHLYLNTSEAHTNEYLVVQISIITKAGHGNVFTVISCQLYTPHIDLSFSLILMAKKRNSFHLKPLDFLRNSFLSSSLIFLSAPWEKKNTDVQTHVEQARLSKRHEPPLNIVHHTGCVCTCLEARCAGETTRGRADVTTPGGSVKHAACWQRTSATTEDLSDALYSGCHVAPSLPLNIKLYLTNASFALLSTHFVACLLFFRGAQKKHNLHKHGWSVTQNVDGNRKFLFKCYILRFYWGSLLSAHNC